MFGGTFIKKTMKEVLPSILATATVYLGGGVCRQDLSFSLLLLLHNSTNSSSSHPSQSDDSGHLAAAKKRWFTMAVVRTRSIS